MGTSAIIPSEGIAWIAGGATHIGTDRPLIKADGEGPVRKLRIKPYGIAKWATTNGAFADFAADTGYVTDAERLGWSFMFRGLQDVDEGSPSRDLPWWNAVNGASWKAPTGPGSDWQGLASHPVVHVSLNDARAYAAWVGGRLPTEAEWEHAARGGNHKARYPWGEAEPDDENAELCNIWQGKFPDHNTCADGYYGTAPAQSFPANAYGIFNMAGNVWEWCADPFRIRSLARAAKERNQKAKADQEFVLKGGSFLCHASYCGRYRIAARSGRQMDNSTINCGFRVAFDQK
tara:strand:- start:4520 stop:5389 length:870 start_codon:yes stop_codon:yes gene_type:complete